ncbi:hypothetical protein [Nonomuraea maheshkhaliensis]
MRRTITALVVCGALLEGSTERGERRREGVFELDAKGGVLALGVTTTRG